MPIRFAVVLLGVFTLALPWAMASDDSAAWAPWVAIAISTDGEAFVTWLPGAVEADSYHVYGIHNGASSLLGIVEGSTSTWVDGGFSEYTVRGVSGGKESPANVAFTLNVNCISVDHGLPPSVNVGCSAPKLGSEVRAQLT